MYKLILILFLCSCLDQIGNAQDSVTFNDAKVIKARAEITVQRYFNILLNTISYTGADNTDIRDLINQSMEDNDKKIFLTKQIAISDDVSDPNYTNSSNSPELSVAQYLNAFNTFYMKSDTNSVYFTDIRSSHIKKGKQNLYINVYFTSYFKNRCLSNPLATYKPTKRVAEVYVKKASNNKWLVYISRIGYYNSADTSRDIANNVVITYPKNQTSSSDVTEGSTKPQSDAAAASLFNLYIDQAVKSEKKRDYQSAINFYYKAIDIQPAKRGVYESHIKELTTVYRKISDLDERYRAGYYKDVIREYSDLLKKPKMNPDYANSDYYFGRGKCFDKLGQQTRSYNEQIKNYSDALADYAKSYEYDNTNMETVRNRAELYRRMDRNIEALTEYKTLVANDPSNLDPYEAMSDLHMQNGELDLATKDIDAALSQENVGRFAKSRLYVDKGALYVRKKDYATAEDYFTRAISLDSNSALAFYYRGMSRIRLNKVQSAARDLVSARQKGLDSADFSFPKDMENYKKFVAYRPNEVPSSLNYEMGNIYMNLGRYDSAYSYLNRSYKSDSLNGYVLYSMASCIYFLGNTEESLRWFERSFRTNALNRNFVDHDTQLGPLQDNKRFKDLKKKYL